VANAFRLEVIGHTSAVRSPIKNIGATSFMYIKAGGIYVVAVSRQNVDATMVFEVLYRVVEIFKSYFDGNFDEDSIRNHFVLTYELLDEILDFGYPQNCSTEVLRLYITQGQGKFGRPDKAGKQAEKMAKITIQATGAIPWRAPDLKYRKNEIYIDVVESVNLLMSGDTNVLRADVSAVVQMKCLLSGMPECKFGMNDKVVLDKEARAGAPKRRGNGIEIDDITFHQCVKLGKFDTDRTISFVPPDGEFELMKYRTTENINLPFKILPIVKEIGRSRVEASITVKSNFNSKMFGTGVIIRIPTPKNTAVCHIICTMGKARYIPEQDGIVWKIRKFPGDTEYTLRAEVELIASVSVEKKAWSRPPITMEFQVPMFTASGFHVRFLKVVEKSNYNTIKWVRYLTKAGNYQVRI
jgi:AP-2 complex subunit mu-1